MSIYSRKNIFILLSALVFSWLAISHIAFAQNESLVSQWDGDAVSGKTALDVVNSNKGTISGSVSVVAPGKVGNAFNLSGSSYIKMGNPANLNFGTGPFSLEAWFNWNGGSEINNIIRKSNYPVTGNGAGYWLRVGNGQLEFFVGETVGNKDQVRGVITAPVNPKVWHHVVATRDSSGAMKLYVDGGLKGTAEAPGANTTSGAVFTIGAWDDRFGVKEFFSGLIDDVSVYNRALDSSEAKSLYDDAGDDVKIYGKIAPYIKKGETPGQCTTVRQCRAYCDLDENFNECVDFAYKAGLIETDNPYLIALQNGTAPGGCIGEDACAEYCGIPGHIKECVAFLEKYTVLPPDVLQILHNTIAACEKEPDFAACVESGSKAKEKSVDLGADLKIGVDASKTPKAILEAIKRGESPGKCKDEVSCRNYCENIDNIKECYDFAVKFNLATPDELKEMRQMAAAKEAGASFPGNCKNKASCLAYCKNSTHQVECMEFAQKAGFIKKEDVEAVNKIIPYLKSGGKLPGECTTKESCDAYCGIDTHANECVDFAVGAGFMTKEDADIVRKTGGKGPGNCRSREACDSYCKDETHIDECVDFAVKAGFISKEDAADAKKYKITSGPGNCKSKADCEAFCVLPENQDTCFNWAKDHGMISKEDLQNIEKYRNQGPPDFSQVDPKWLACMEKEMGPAIFGRFKAGKSERSEFPAVGAAQKKCESLMGPDIRKEIEVCLSKTTCAEFNSCFDALPKGNQQSSGQGPQNESGGKIKARVSACFEEKIDACLALSCSEFTTCMKSFQQGSGKQGTGDQKQQQGTENPKITAKVQTCQKELVETQMRECTGKPNCAEVNACLKTQQSGAKSDQGQGQKDQGQKVELPADIKSRLNACQQEEVQKKMDVCLDKSCPEFDACISALQQGGGEQGGQQQGQGTQDPKITAKVQVCQKEKVNACIAKPCSEFQACLNSLGGGGGGKQQQGGTTDPAVTAKFTSCAPKQQQPPSAGSSTSPQVDCSSFASTPQCSYVGSPDSQSYQLCKQCFPNK